jgi:hypothetical protein
MKVTMLVESFLYFIFSPGFLHSSDVYRRDSDRYHTLPFFLKFFIIILKLKVTVKVFKSSFVLRKFVTGMLCKL